MKPARIHAKFVTGIMLIAFGLALCLLGRNCALPATDSGFAGLVLIIVGCLIEGSDAV